MKHSYRKNFDLSSSNKLEKILSRQKRLSNLHRAKKLFEEESKLDSRLNVNERPKRVVLLKDDSSFYKKTHRIISTEYADAHIFIAENMTQALIEIEQREYDLLILNLEQHIPFPNYFSELMQRHYSYLNILFLGLDKVPNIKAAEKGSEGSYFSLPEHLHSKAIARVFQSIFEKHSNYRRRIDKGKNLSRVEQKILAFQHAS